MFKLEQWVLAAYIKCQQTRYFFVLPEEKLSFPSSSVTALARPSQGSKLLIEIRF